MLGIRRLGRRHPVVVDQSTVWARAVCRSERGHTIRRRVGAVSIARGRSRCRRCSSTPVGVGNSALRGGNWGLRLGRGRGRLRVLVALGRGRSASSRRSRSIDIVVRLAHLLLLLRTRLSLQRRSGTSSERLTARLVRVGGLRRGVDVGEAASPVLSGSLGRRRGARSRGLLSRASPLRSDRTRGLISLRVHIGGLGSGRWGTSISATRTEELKASLDVWVAGVEFGSTLVSIQRICDLVVAALILELG